MILDDANRIDSQRTDASVPCSGYVDVRIGAPVTQGSMRYSETVIVDFEEGRFPSWFLPFTSSFRRLDLDPVYGFFVDGQRGGRYCSIPLTALVLDHTSYDTAIIKRLRSAAEGAGWKCNDQYGLIGFVGEGMDIEPTALKGPDQYLARSRSGDTRIITITVEEMREMITDYTMPYCSGPCECTIEPDGTCPDGWPSVLLVAGVM